MKKKHLVYFATLTAAFLTWFQGCRVDDPVVNIPGSGFPADVGKIFLTKCATSGCHNEQSKEAAAGLSLASWNSAFEGGRNGACIIPYRPDYSLCMYYVNTFSDLGPSLVPHMPFNGPSLSRNEVITIQGWIMQGAPDNQGHVAFASNPLRKKIYVTNQGCDEVAVIDAQTKLVMRYIHVGNSPVIEIPHKIVVSPDGNYWYVSFLNSTCFQKFRTSDDSYVGQISVGPGSWNSFALTADSKKAYMGDWNSPGRIFYMDMDSLSLLATYASASTGYIDWPHGIAVNHAASEVYIGANNDRYVYKIDITDPLHPVLNNVNNILLTTGSTFTKAHDIDFTPDGTKYIVACTGTNDVRILNVSKDSVIAIIPTGYYPQEIAVSQTMPYAFITCQEDTTYFPGYAKKGVITCINYLTNQFVANIDAGTYQPHGIDIDEVNGLVYIASRNINPNGPAPHHTSVCGGRDGYMTAIDMHTLKMVPGYRPEMAVDPYSVAVRP